MAHYTLISSRDPFESRDVDRYLGMAADLRRAGHEVALYLVQNGVFSARKSAASSRLAELADLGVEVHADAFSLRERGIPGHALERGIRSSDVDLLVDHLADGRRVIWH
jgi:sulfur relay (sulfurtransferase) complex TusBCD TusD component (DsrE family)